MFVRRRYSFFENLFRILEVCRKPMLKTHIQSTFNFHGGDMPKYLGILLEGGYLTYIGVSERDYNKRKSNKHFKEFLVITDEGKRVLKLWGEIKRRLELNRGKNNGNI